MPAVSLGVGVEPVELGLTLGGGNGRRLLGVGLLLPGRGLGCRLTGGLLLLVALGCRLRLLLAGALLDVFDLAESTHEIPPV